MKRGLANVEDFYPLAPMQQGMLYHTLASIDREAYCQQASFVIEGSVDARLLAQAWQHVIDLHPILRTGFVWKGLSQPVQVVYRQVTAPVKTDDWSAHEPSTQAAMLEGVLSAERKAGFDLARAPAMRVLLVREAERRFRLIWTYHHVILDGYSANRVLDQVLEGYRRLADGGEPETRPAPPFSEYIRWLTKQDRAAAEGYWRRALAGYVSPTPLGVDRALAPGEIPGSTVATETLQLSKETTARLEQFGRDHKLTLNTLVQGAFGLLLGRYSGHDEVVFGSTVSARPADIENVEESVGVFINTLPVRLRLPDSSPVVAWLRELQDAQAEARLYDFASLVDIHGLTGVPRDRPLFDSILVFGNYGGSAPTRRENAPLRIRDYRSWESSTYALNAFAEPGPRLGLGVVYLCSRFDPGTVRRLLGHWATLLDTMSAAEGRRLADLTPLTDTEYRLVVDDSNQTERSHPQGVGIHELVRAHGFSKPEAVAVASPDGDLTYGVLDARARALAAHLITLGARTGDYVGVYMRRCPDVVVALLGVLDSGAAFVPLDPAWPTERTRQILERLRVTCVLTERTQSRRLHDACLGLAVRPSLVYLDVEEQFVPAEGFDRVSVKAFWDHLAETATDRISAAGFVSAETGAPFTAPEVDAYVQQVVDLAVGHLAQPSAARILEIGCGSGLIMQALAPHVGTYTGVDPSAETQRRNRERLEQIGLDNVALRTGFADELDDLEDATFDLVVLASTAQFFPGPAYFEHVVDRALKLLNPGGALLLCDLLCPPPSEPAGHPDPPSGRGHARSRQTLGGQYEAGFCIDRPYLEEVAATRRGRATLSVFDRPGFTNELRFRYDALLVKTRTPATPGGATLAHQDTTRPLVSTRWHLERAGTPGQPVTGSDRVAYVIHTSGSTGVPKGVVVSHQPVVNLIDWVNRTFSVGPSDRLLWTASLCFDLSIYDIFGLLTAGGTVRIATEAELADPEKVASIMLTEPITFWDSAPAALQRVVPFLSPPGGRVSSTTLRLVFLSGDWVPVGLPDEVRSACPGARVIALGGATEATVWSNYYPVGDVDPDWPSIPYGRPIQNARYYVLDRRTAPVPVGVPGELYIGGECLSEGYVGECLVTAEKFRPDPFAHRPGARMYRTGDRVRFLADGNLQFLGRVDRQLKIRGHRIEPGEIEAALTAHPVVDSAVVVGAERTVGDWRLSAYLVGSAERPPETEFRQYLSRRLPAYMVPSAYVWLDAIPMTPNGKLDRAALPDPYSQRGTADDSPGPQTDLERSVADLWCEVLGVDRVGRDENFFDLGGHSLLLIQLHGKLQKTIREDLAIVDIFRFPTVTGLAQHLAGQSDLSDPSHDGRIAQRRTVAHVARRRLASRDASRES